MSTIPVNALTATTGLSHVGKWLTGPAKGSIIAWDTSVSQSPTVLWTALAMNAVIASDQAMNRKLEMLSDRIRVLEDRADQRSVIVPIQSLEPGPVEVTQPILAVVYEEDGVFVASFADANINASGESQLEAVEMLKDVLASSFRVFIENEAVLGREPQRQLTVLRRFLRIP